MLEAEESKAAARGLLPEPLPQAVLRGWAVPLGSWGCHQPDCQPPAPAAF